MTTPPLARGAGRASPPRRSLLLVLVPLKRSPTGAAAAAAGAAPGRSGSRRIVAPRQARRRRRRRGSVGTFHAAPCRRAHLRLPHCVRQAGLAGGTAGVLHQASQHLGRKNDVQQVQ